MFVAPDHQIQKPRELGLLYIIPSLLLRENGYDDVHTAESFDRYASQLFLYNIPQYKFQRKILCLV